MKIHQIKILAILVGFLLFSCNTKEPEPYMDPNPLPDADLVLDDLVDKEVYTEGMLVDCRYFDGKVTSRLLINHTEYETAELVDMTRAGYYRIEIFTSGSSGSEPDVIRMVVLDPERGEAEWGLPPWTPRGVEVEAIGSQEIQMIYPRQIPEGFAFPLIVVVDGQLTRSTDNLKASVGSNTFLIKRGVGSTWLSSGQAKESLVIDHRTFPIQTAILEGAPTSLSGVISSSMLIPSGSYVRITSDLTIPAGINLTFEEGSFVSIDPAVNIYNEGGLYFLGSEESPITVSCSDPNSYWGGVIGTGAGNSIEATHTIFGRSGYHSGAGYDWGHAHRQALFYSVNGSIFLKHAYMIDHVGQICYTESATLNMEFCLVQRAKTGGQQNFSKVSVSHSVFTDFPDDSNVYRDNDNDALYLIACFANISSSVFMYAKDDGLDSGGGGTDGMVRVSDTRFEANFHEGAALSGGTMNGKEQHFSSCIFVDCGQGLELGFSSYGHQVFADSCRFLRNGVGIRFGDCYDFGNKGYLSVSNSESLENEYADVWNMDRLHWSADTSHMSFDNVWVTKGNPIYPQLKILE